MRKPRDFDAELQALEHKARSLKERRVRQLGELVAATGAGALDAETLAGGLLAMMEADDPAREESWRKRGQAFFQRRPRDVARGAQSRAAGAAANKGDAASARGGAGAS
jgi:DNA-binding protein H-NS